MKAGVLLIAAAGTTLLSSSLLLPCGAALPAGSTASSAVGGIRRRTSSALDTAASNGREVLRRRLGKDRGGEEEEPPEPPIEKKKGEKGKKKEEEEEEEASEEYVEEGDDEEGGGGTDAPSTSEPVGGEQDEDADDEEEDAAADGEDGGGDEPSTTTTIDVVAVGDAEVGATSENVVRVELQTFLVTVTTMATASDGGGEGGDSSPATMELPSAYALSEQLSDQLLEGFREVYPTSEAVTLDVVPVGGDNDQDAEQQDGDPPTTAMFRVSGTLYMEASSAPPLSDVRSLQMSILQEGMTSQSLSITGIDDLSALPMSASAASAEQQNADDGQNTALVSGIIVSAAAVAAIAAAAILVRRRGGGGRYGRYDDEDDDLDFRVMISEANNRNNRDSSYCDIETESLGVPIVKITSVPSKDEPSSSNDNGGGNNAGAGSRQHEQPETVLFQKLQDHYASSENNMDIFVAKTSLDDLESSDDDSDEEEVPPPPPPPPPLEEADVDGNLLADAGSLVEGGDDNSGADGNHFETDAIPPIPPCNSMTSMATLETVEEESVERNGAVLVEGKAEQDEKDGSKSSAHDNLNASEDAVICASGSQDSQSVASSQNNRNRLSPMKWMRSRSGDLSREDYCSDSESQFTYGQVGVPLAAATTVMASNIDAGATSVASTKLLGGGSFDVDEDASADDLIMKIVTKSTTNNTAMFPPAVPPRPRARSASPALRSKKLFQKETSPTSCFHHPYGRRSARDDEDDDPLRIGALTSNKSGMGSTGHNLSSSCSEGNPFDETLEDEQDLESFAAELELLRGQVRIVGLQQREEDKTNKDGEEANESAENMVAKQHKNIQKKGGRTSRSQRRQLI